MTEYLKAEILKDHSKANVLSILKWIGEDEQKVEQLIKLFLAEDAQTVQRASWIISSLAEFSPKLMQKHLQIMIDRMVDASVHVGVRRNMIRSLQFMEIPESMHGVILDACFSFLENPKEGNVVQVFAMSVIERLTNEYPEIIPEFQLIIERNLENGASPAFKSRARKTLIRLNKRNN